MHVTKIRSGAHDGGGAPLSAQTSRSTAAAPGRFVEGSMNDRTSAAPPELFLGPEQLSAYERQFYVQPPIAYHHNLAAARGPGVGDRSDSGKSMQHGHPSSHHDRPGNPNPPGPSLTHAKKPSTGGSKFFAPLWDGVREKLHLTRARSSSEIAAAEKREREQERRTAQAPAPMPMAPPPPVPVAEGSAAQPGGPYPTREEILDNYHQLVASGFFSSHAIQGSRHPVPRQTRRSVSAHGVVVPPPLSASAALPARTFAQHMASPNPPPSRRVSSSSRLQQTRVLAFSSVPYASTRPPTAAEAPSTVPPPPRESEWSSAAGVASARPSEDMERPPHNLRGTKRGPPAEAENPARKLVKRLRKSASRISVDLSLTSSKDTSKSRPSTSSAVSGAPDSFASGPLHGFSFDDAAKDSASTAPSTTSATSGGGKRTPTKLRKRAGFTLRRQRPGSAGRSPAPSQRSAQPDSADGTETPAGRSSLSSLGGFPVPPLNPGGGGQTRLYEDADDMDVDTPRCSRSVSRSVSPDKQGGLAPPSFHYPYRLRTRAGPANEPLSVVPDLNRGIPVVPKIPDHFRAKEPGNRDSGLGGSDDAVGVADENYYVSWYRE